MLIASDNAAARALARVSPYGSEAFVRRMNEKARELGLTNTSYADPSGLLSTNVSSAYDMARLITYVSGDERIASIMRKPYYTVPVGRQHHPGPQHQSAGDAGRRGRAGGEDRFHQQVPATAWRRCCGCRRADPQVAVVVLGAKSNAGRFWETRHLFNWLSSARPPICSARRLPAAATRRRIRSDTPARFDVPMKGLRGRPALLRSAVFMAGSGGVSALDRRRVERQRRDAIDHRHHRSGGAPRVERLQIAMAHVAGVDAISCPSSVPQTT